MARALSQSTLSDDSKAEVMIIHHLGLMAIASEDPLRASFLFENAAEQSSFSNNTRLVISLPQNLSTSGG